MDRLRGQLGRAALTTLLVAAGGAGVGAGVTVAAYEAGSGGGTAPSRDTTSASSRRVELPRIERLEFQFPSGWYEYDGFPSRGPECEALDESAGNLLWMAVIATKGVDGAPEVTLRIGGKAYGSPVDAEPFDVRFRAHETLWNLGVFVPAGTIPARTSAPLEATVSVRDKAGGTAEDTVTTTLRSCAVPLTGVPLPVTTTPKFSPAPTTPKSSPAPTGVTTTTQACNPNDPGSPGFPCQA